MNVTINGNIVTLGGFTGMSLLAEVDRRMLTQFSAFREDDGYFSLSFPMENQHHSEFAGQIHRQNNENKLGKKLDTGIGKPDNDPTPPGRGGGAKVAEYVKTQAIAA